MISGQKAKLDPIVHSVVDDLYGSGTSFSIGVGKYSGSITFPDKIGELGTKALIFELGVGRLTIGESINAISNVVGFIHNTITTTTQASYSERPSASGGFVLYPNRPNTNQLQLVYKK